MEIVSPQPVPVIIKGGGMPGVQSQVGDPSIPARTTFQQDLTFAGQRAINMKWETTQSNVAQYVIVGTMVIFGMVVVISLIANRDITTAQALLLGSIMSLATGVTSFYFSRTNHAAIGGVGDKPVEKYEGR